VDSHIILNTSHPWKREMQRLKWFLVGEQLRDAELTRTLERIYSQRYERRETTPQQRWPWTREGWK